MLGVYWGWVTGFGDMLQGKAQGFIRVFRLRFRVQGLGFHCGFWLRV